MLDTNQNLELGTFLIECINKIKKRSPNLSSNAIANKLNIAPSTFSRIENLEVKNTSFDHAIKIVRMACPQDLELKNFIQKYYPEMLSNFLKVYPFNSNIPFINIEAENYFQDINTYEIMMLATTNAGCTKAKITKEFGQRGLGQLEILLKENVLTEIDGVISSKKSINCSQETTHKLLGNLINHNYSSNNFNGTTNNWLSLQYESINKELAVPELQNIIHEANQKIRSLFNNEKFCGNDTLWVGLIVDSL